MEYLIPILLTFMAVYTTIVYGSKTRGKYLKKIMYSQSSMHNRIRYIYPVQTYKKEKIKSQADKHISKNMIRIIFFDNKAYWIADNVFYVAEMSEGSIISETTKQIDTSEMSKDELDKMLVILDNLKDEGE